MFFVFGIDLDNDGMDDAWEALMGLNNTSADDADFDNDSDGLTNLWEFRLGFHPFDNDSDSNYTLANESSNSVLDGDEDLDSDGLSNYDEIFVYGTDPLSDDTDSDGLTDGDEILIYGTNATSDDTDSDGLTDGEEILIYHSNPLSSDTDSDSRSDFDEVSSGRDPTVGITYSQDKSSLAIGDEVVYSFNVTSTYEIFNSSVSCILPAGLVFSDSANNGSFVSSALGQNVSFDLGNLSGFHKYGFSVTAYLNDSPLINDSVILDSAEFVVYYQNSSTDYRRENESSGVLGVLEPDVAIVVLRNVSVLGVSDLVNFTIGFVSNPVMGYNFTIGSYLEDGLDFVSSSVAPFSVSGNNVTFKFDNSSLIENISIIARVNTSYDNLSNVLAHDVFGLLANVSYFSYDNLSRARGYNDSDYDDVSVFGPLLSVVSQQSNATVGEFVNFSVILDFSSSPANDVVFNFSVPLGMEYDNYASSLAVSGFSQVLDVLVFDYDNLSSAGVVEINISLKINRSVYENDVLNATGNLSYRSSDGFGYFVYDYDFLACSEPELFLGKNVFSPVSVSDLVTYLITISNTGSSPARNVTLIETIANGTEIISATSAFSMSGAYNETLQFNLSEIAAGSSFGVNITVNVTEQYFDGSYVLANDTLEFVSNVSYQSVWNSSDARLYDVSISANTTIQEGAITKTTNATITINSNPSARIGEEFLYEIVVNFSGAPANSVVIDDRLDDAIVFVSQNNSLNNSAFLRNGQLLSWDFGNLSPSTKFIYINVTGFVNESSPNVAGSSILNVANLTYANTFGASVLKQDSSVVFVAEPNIDVSNFLVNVADVKISDFVNYTINVSNIERGGNEYNSIAYNVTLVEFIPDGLVLDSSSVAADLSNSTHLIWNVGDLAVNGTFVVNLVFEVNQSYLNSTIVTSEDLFENYVSVLAYSTQNETRARNYSTDSYSGIVKVASPFVNVTNNATSFSIGDEVSYQIVLNLSSAPANNVTLFSVVPFGLDIINLSAGSNVSFSQSGNNLSWGFGDLGLASLFVINVTTVINNSVNYGDNLNHFVNLSYESSNHSSFDAIDNDLVVIAEPEVMILENVFSPVSVSDTLTYLVNLTNAGNSIAYNTTFVHEIFNGTVVVSTSPLFDLKSGANNETFTFYVGDIAVGASVEFNFTVNVTEQYFDSRYLLANDTLSAFSNVSYQSTSDFSLSRFYQNSSVATTTVQEGAIVKDSIGTISVHSDEAVRLGEMFNYTIFINFTGAPANSILVEDNLPSGLVFVLQNNSYNNTAFSDLGSGDLVWNFGNLTPLTKTIRINVTAYVNSSSAYVAGDVIVNVANLTYSNIHGSSVLKQDSSDVEVVESKIVLVKSVSDISDVEIGDFINYTINLTNWGDSSQNYFSEAFNVSLFENIPSGLVLNYSSVAADFVNSSLMRWDFGTLNINQSHIIDLIFEVNETFRDSSYVSSNDVFVNNVSVYAQSVVNLSMARIYDVVNSSLPIQVESPLISVNVNVTNLTIGKFVEAFVLIDFSSSAGKSVNVSVPLYLGLEFVNASCNDNVSFSDLGYELIWEFGELSDRRVYSLNVTFAVNSSLNSGDNVVVLGNLTHKSSDGTLYSLNDNDDFNVTEPNILIDVLSVATKEIGDNATLVVNVTNAGNSIARNVTLTTLIANGTVFDFASPVEDSLSGAHLRVVEHRLGDILVGESLQVNVSLIVLENYTDDSNVLTGDRLWNYFNASYFSSLNLLFAKRYVNSTNLSIVISSPEIDVSINSSLVANNLSAITIGDIFEYRVLLNFTARSTTQAFVENVIPLNLTFVSQNNSLNNSAFNVSGNVLSWNFTSLNPSTQIVWLNVSVFAQNVSSNVWGTNLSSTYNLTYKNSLNEQINKFVSYDITVAEPNLDSNVSSNVSVASVLDDILFTVYVSNENRAEDYSSRGYNVSVVAYLSDGLEFVSSSHSRLDSNTRNLSFDFSGIDVDEVVAINIVARINDTLLNGSFNHLSDVSVDSFVRLFSSSDSAIARAYSDFTGRTVVIHDITKPLIHSSSVTPKAVATGQDVMFLMNATDEVEELDSCWVEVLMPNSTRVNVTNACAGVNYTTPALIGTYNLTFFANDTSNNVANVSGLSFKVGPPVVFNSTIVDTNNSALNVSVEIYIDDTLVASDENVSGNLSETLSVFVYDVLFKSFNESFVVRLSGVNASENNNERIGFDKDDNLSDALVVYAVMNDYYNFTNATVTISYANLSYSNENYLAVQVCENWNFTGKICLGSWGALSASRNSALDIFSFVRTSFSAFRIVEIIPPSGGGGGSSSPSGSTSMNFTIVDTEDEVSVKCFEHWACREWEDCDGKVERRVCVDMNSCGTFFSIPNRVRSCGVNDTTVNVIGNDNAGENINSGYVAYGDRKKSLFEKTAGSAFVLVVIYILLLLIIFNMKNKVYRALDNDKIYVHKKLVRYYRNIGKNDAHKRSLEMVLIGLSLVVLMTIVFVLFSNLFVGMVFGIFSEVALMFYLHNHAKHLRD